MLRRSLLQGLAAATLVGCGSPVKVLRQSPGASPGKLPGFAVLPFRYDRFIMLGKPLAEWLATRTDDQKTRFQADKERMERQFVGTLQKNGGAWSFDVGDEGSLKPEHGRIATEVLGEMHGIFQLQSPAGQVLDEVEVEYAVGFGDISSHMQVFGGMAADRLLDHLSARR